MDRVPVYEFLKLKKHSTHNNVHGQTVLGIRTKAKLIMMINIMKKKKKTNVLNHILGKFTIFY